MHTLQSWKLVPVRVADLLPAAARIKVAHVHAAKKIGFLSHSFATWNPHTNQLNIYSTAPIEKTAQDAYRQKIQNVTPVFRDAAHAAPDINNEIVVKRAGIPILAPAIDFTQKALGGPNPLTNTIVGSLLAGGLGYGAGTLIENLFPERYIERGHLRKNLGLLGVLGGVGVGAANAYSNARNSMTGQDFYRAPFRNFLGGYVIPNAAPIPRLDGGPVRAINDLPQSRSPSILDDRPKYAADGFTGLNSQFNSSGLYTPMIPVQQFNQSVWQDTQRGMMNGFQQHTPPAYAAATTGMLNGLSVGTQSPIIRPIDVIHGIASAGVGLATANIAGRTLSALAGLTPAGQEKLQDLGLFGGMMHAIAPAILGLR